MECKELIGFGRLNGVVWEGIWIGWVDIESVFGEMIEKQVVGLDMGIFWRVLCVVF